MNIHNCKLLTPAALLSGLILAAAALTATSIPDNSRTGSTTQAGTPSLKRDLLLVTYRTGGQDLGPEWKLMTGPAAPGGWRQRPVTVTLDVLSTTKPSDTLKHSKKHPQANDTRKHYGLSTSQLGALPSGQVWIGPIDVAGLDPNVTEALMPVTSGPPKLMLLVKKAETQFAVLSWWEQ